MTRVQKINYLGPKLEVTLGEYKLTETVESFHVWSSRIDPADVAELSIANLDRALDGKIATDEKLSISWGYKGFELEPLFNGLVAEVLEGDKFFIRAVDPMKKLFDARITKTYQEERPATIISNLIDLVMVCECRLPEAGAVLDKLPLYDDHIVQAIRTINKRMNLDHHFWFDVEGVFHWEPLVISDESAWQFREGENIIALNRNPNGTTRLLTIGLTASHGERVMVESFAGETADYWIEKAHHYQEPDQGFRTELFLREIS